MDKLEHPELNFDLLFAASDFYCLGTGKDEQGGYGGPGYVCALQD